MSAAAQSWRTISHLHWQGYWERVSICSGGSPALYEVLLQIFTVEWWQRCINLTFDTIFIQQYKKYNISSLKHKSCLHRLRVLQWLSFSTVEADGWRDLLPYNWDLWHRAHAVHHLQYKRSFLRWGENFQESNNSSLVCWFKIALGTQLSRMSKQNTVLLHWCQKWWNSAT